MAKTSKHPDIDLAVVKAICLTNSQGGLDAVVRSYCPSTDLNDAFNAASHAGLFDVVRDGPEVHLARTIDGQWEILTGGSEMGYIARESTPALAICAAILKVNEKKLI